MGRLWGAATYELSWMTMVSDAERERVCVWIALWVCVCLLLTLNSSCSGMRMTISI